MTRDPPSTLAVTFEHHAWSCALVATPRLRDEAAVRALLVAASCVFLFGGACAGAELIGPYAYLFVVAPTFIGVVLAQDRIVRWLRTPSRVPELRLRCEGDSLTVNGHRVGLGSLGVEASGRVLQLRADDHAWRIDALAEEVAWVADAIGAATRALPPPPPLPPEDLQALRGRDR